jgi:hypothetical protein
MLIQMAKDIQLHDEIMRMRLKGCSGYEVSTEGDSFKCVFHTPEDAVMYCILTQLDLLTARWSPELESGGQEFQKGKADWADVQCPRLTKSKQSIIKQQVKCSNSFNMPKVPRMWKGSDRRMSVVELNEGVSFSAEASAAGAFFTEWNTSQVYPLYYPPAAACASPSMPQSPSQITISFKCRGQAKITSGAFIQRNVAYILLLASSIQ